MSDMLITTLSLEEEMMRLELYLKRQKISIEKLVKVIDAKSYDDLLNHLKSIGIKCPPEDQLGYEFKTDVEKRPVVKSSAKKKRVSDKKSSKPKTNDSTSTGGSGSRQRIRKSTTKRQRKSDSDKVESVQPASGSEDTK